MIVAEITEIFVSIQGGRRSLGGQVRVVVQKGFRCGLTEHVVQRIVQINRVQVGRQQTLI